MAAVARQVPGILPYDSESRPSEVVEEEVDETTMTAEVEVVVSALAAASFHRHPSTCPSLVTSEAEVVAAAEASMVVEVSSYPSAFAAESVVASVYQEATEEKLKGKKH